MKASSASMIWVERKKMSALRIFACSVTLIVEKVELVPPPLPIMVRGVVRDA